MSKPAMLVLADGSVFHGISIGADGYTTGEVVFNTAMTGYQEILTDPSYSQQIVTLTYPHIGNTGTTPEDNESHRVWAAGLVIRDLPLVASSWRNRQPLGLFLQESGTMAIAEIDTRQLTRLLRRTGSQMGCMVAGEALKESEALEAARSATPLSGLDLAKESTCPSSYECTTGAWNLFTDQHAQVPREALPIHVVVYDFGIKLSILHLLVERGCRLTVVPATTSAADVLSLKPDGVVLSNGPGDPEPCNYAIDAIRTLLLAKVPMFGICLGHQLLALASGAKTMKMPFGHHGANHPVLDTETGRVMITSQNHGFAVDAQSLPQHLEVVQRSLFDGSLQGIRRTDVPAFGFQGHPEASPGPMDVAHLFDQFIHMLTAQRISANTH